MGDDLLVPAADAVDQRVPRRDGMLQRFDGTPRPGELGRVGIGPDAERVDLADADLRREPDQADRRRHLRRRVVGPALPQGQLGQGRLRPGR